MRPRRLRTLALCAILASCTWSHGQLGAQEGASNGTGTIRGRVLDQETNETLPGVRVRIIGMERNTATRLDGVFEFGGIPGGVQTLQASADGFRTERVTVVVETGSVTERDIVLIPESVADESGVEEIIVTAPLIEGTETEVLIEREKSRRVQDSISSEQMSKAGASDAGEAVSQLPAVSIKDGQFAFVRGLGERYSQTLVNGSSIPSPEPDKKVVPLDLFPANLLESIVVAKTYSADIPAEFSGGSVQIRTMDVPEEGFFEVGLGLKYLDGTTLRDFQTYEGGNLDILTFSDSTRDLPDAVPSEQVSVGSSVAGGLTAQQVQEIGRSFNNIWDPHAITAPPAFDVNLSLGRSFEVSDDGRIGLIGALNWGNKYQTIEDEEFRILLNAGTIDQPRPVVFNDFKLDTYKFSSELSALLNFTYEINRAQNVGVRNLYTRGFDDQVRLQRGFDGQQEREIRVTQLRTVERSLLVTQTWGEHLLVLDSVLDWRLSYALSQRDEPDNRQVRYDFRETLGEFSFEDIFGSGRRDFYQLDENIYDGGLDLSIPVTPFVEQEIDAVDPDSIRPDQLIKIGGAFVYRDRDFDSRRFRFQPTSVAGRPEDEFGNPIDQTTSAEDLFRAKNINPRGFQLLENTRPTDNYAAEQLLLAGYGLFDIKLFPTLRLEAGVRVERSDQTVITSELFGDPPDEIEAELDETDFLPAVNLSWEFYEDMQLRLGGSRTVSRPEFRELAEFEFVDIQGGFSAVGNPELERARIWNLDLRWDWFPKGAGPDDWFQPRGDLISAGVFFKRFDQPIEQVVIPTGSALISSWENADSADLFGFEIEVRKSFGFLNRWLPAGPLRDLSILGNVALIESEVKIAEGTVALTNDRRPLQGQPDYVLNLGLVYDSRDHGVTAALFANTFGENIVRVGAFGLPDETEQPRWSLDFNISKRIGDASLKLSVENILDDEFEFEQGAFTTRSFRKGVAVGLSYTYSF